jgi:hypothetical protein
MEAQNSPSLFSFFWWVCFCGSSGGSADTTHRQRCTFVSILQLGVQRGTSIGGMPQSSKTIAGGPIDMAPLK